MDKGTPDCITDQHLMLFGAVIQWFARHEVLMEEIMASLSGADATSIKLLTSGLNFTEKRDALFNLLSHRAVPLDQIDRMQRYLVVLRTFTPLRNDIAHSAWIKGKPDNLISPAWLSHGSLKAVKPEHEIGEQAKVFIEHYEDQVTYTLDNLKETVERLEINYVGFQEYAAGIGLLSSNAV